MPKTSRCEAGFLLDTNVLIALAWRNQVHHDEALVWFRQKAATGFRTCPITQTGFVRIPSNASFSTGAVSPAEAMELLRRITELPGHGFWAEDLPLIEALGDDPVPTSHRQMLSLAAIHDAVLATLDRGIVRLARGFPGRLELIYNK